MKPALKVAQMYLTICLLGQGPCNGPLEESGERGRGIWRCWKWFGFGMEAPHERGVWESANCDAVEARKWQYDCNMGKGDQI